MANFWADPIRAVLTISRVQARAGLNRRAFFA